MSSDSPLEKRRILVTGASSGIGEATARVLAGAGARLHLTGRHRSALEALAHELTTETRTANHTVADLRSTTDIDKLFDEIDGHPDPLAAVVNAAGIAYHARTTDGDPDEWREMLEVNVLALALVTQQAVARFQGNGGRGHVIHLSSMSGHRVPPIGGFYAATKHAVRAHAEALRCELRAAGSAVKVTCISPGFVDTPLIERYFKDRQDQIEPLRQSGAALDPAVIGQAVLYALTAPDSTDVNDILLRSNRQGT